MLLFALCKYLKLLNNPHRLCATPGESVTVTVSATEGETAALLASVLDGDHTAASLLAQAIHQNPATIDTITDSLTLSLSPSDLGIWIDPIGERLVVFLSASENVSRS